MIEDVLIVSLELLALCVEILLAVLNVLCMLLVELKMVYQDNKVCFLWLCLFGFLFVILVFDVSFQIFILKFRAYWMNCIFNGIKTKLKKKNAKLTYLNSDPTYITPTPTQHT